MRNNKRAPRFRLQGFPIWRHNLYCGNAADKKRRRACNSCGRRFR